MGMTKAHLDCQERCCELVGGQEGKRSITNMATIQDQEVYEKLRQLADANADAQLAAAMSAYEDARSDGLCHEGAWECALAAMGGTMVSKSL